MEKFNKIFKKVFAVLIVFALLFAMNVKADENAGQVDNQYSQTEEKQKEIETAPPSSVPPETVSQAGDNQTLTTGENNKPVVVETTPGGGDNLTTPGDDTSKVDEVNTSKQTTLDTPTEGNDDDKKELPKVEETLEKSDDVQAQINKSGTTETSSTDEGKEIEQPKTRGEVPASTGEGTGGDTSGEVESQEPATQLLGAGSGAKAAGDDEETVFYTNISHGSTITAKALLAKVDITVSDSDITNVTIGESTTYLTVTNSGNVYSITNNGSYSGTLPIIITTALKTYTVNVDSGPDRSKELIDYEDGTYRLELTVTGDSESSPPPINVLVIYDESSSMLKYWVDDSYGAVGHKGDDLLNDNRYYSDENPDIDASYIGTNNGQNNGTPISYLPANREGYFPLYKQVDGSYVKITTDEQYTGTLYMRTGENSYAVYGDDDNEKYVLNGQTLVKRFSTRRADASENAIRTFVTDLYNANPNTQIALVGFASDDGTSTEVNWTPTSTNVTSILSETGDRNTYNKDLGYVSGTNYESALRQGITLLNNLNNTNKTFVIFFTDGEPSQSMTDPTATPTSANSRQYYIDTREETKTIRERANTTFYGIYAYGRENDYLDDLVYDAHYATPRTNITGNPPDTTGITDWYFKANNTAELKNAMANIFGQIIEGIGSTEIIDGTTSHVVISETASSHLLDVDTSSFKYYKNNVVWEDAPEAHLNEDGQVIWDLGKNIILEDGVTYKVTFDVWPSQETLDLMADLKNQTVSYDGLPAEIKKYITCEGTNCTLRTNTTAIVNYVDTRPNGTDNGTSVYVNPDPVPTTAVKIMEVVKKWNGGAEQDVNLYVSRDTDNTWFKVPVTTSELKSEGEAAIAIGILTDHDNVVNLRTTGHNYTFYEDGNNAYHWEIKAPIYRPMLINGSPRMLEKLDESKSDSADYIFYVIKKTETVTDENNQQTTVVTERSIAVKGNQSYTAAADEEILSTSYYKLTTLTEFVLEGTNERRSNLDIIKEVTGNDEAKAQKFRFDLTVTSAPSNNPIDHDIWFSVADTTLGSWDPIVVDTDATPEKLSLPDNATNASYDAGTNSITFSVGEDTYTYKCIEGNSVETCKYYTNYYSVVSGTPFYVMMKNGYSLRIRNILTGSTYTITETPASDFTTTVDTYIMRNGTKENWPANDEDDSVSVDGMTVSGTIKETSINYTVKYTNSHEEVDIEITKNWDDANNQDGIRPETIYVKVLDDEGTTVRIEAITAETAEISEDGNTWKYVITGLNKYKNNQEIEYSIEEVADANGTAITNYTEGSTAIFTLDTSTNGKYKYVLTDAEGYVITNTHIPEDTTATVKKVWDDDDNRDNVRPASLTVGMTMTIETT